jgi:hypothetical protein
MIAKAFKIRDRLRQAGANPSRLTDKDAGDVLRIMMTAPPGQVADSFAMLTNNERVGVVSREGVDLLREFFGGQNTPGVNMAVSAFRGDVPEERVRALAPAFVNQLS